MSKNECEFTLFSIAVNEIVASITYLDSIGYGPSTAPCRGIGAGNSRSAISMRVTPLFSFFRRCENEEKNRMDSGALEFSARV
jgi:hypothetical protein